MQKQSVTIQEFEERLEELMDWVNETKGVVYVLDDSGEPSVVMIAYTEAVELGITDGNEIS